MSPLTKSCKHAFYFAHHCYMLYFYTNHENIEDHIPAPELVLHWLLALPVRLQLTFTLEAWEGDLQVNTDCAR